MSEPGGYGEALDMYRQAGWTGVLPLHGKVLAVKGVSGREGRWPSTDEIDRWIEEFADNNVALRLPQGVIGVDIDAYGEKRGGETLATLEAQYGSLPPTWRSSAREDPVSGIRIFKVSSGDIKLPSELGPGIEIVQFHHRYSVVWPSKHPDLGTTYRWYTPQGVVAARVPGLWDIPMIPQSWETGLTSREYSPPVEPGRPAERGGSLLSQLLAVPPAAAGSRNNWLTRVAGHIAKTDLHDDGYTQLILTINRSLDEPLDEAEAMKTATSIWQAEQAARSASGLSPVQGTGWLVSGGNHILAGTKEKGGEMRLEPCSDFDIKVIGKYTDERFSTFYKVRLVSEINRDDRFMTEPASMFGDNKTLRKRLQAMECNIWKVMGDVGNMQAQDPIMRLGHYVSSQEAPTLEVVPHMGWHDAAGGFVCDEGVISATDVKPETSFVLDPMVRTRDPLQNKYGFEGDWDQAQKILNEVLTYQDETVTSVFGAWWAACFIKPLIMQKASFFPFMAIEAMSGTGKTEGFFNLMVQLNGAIRLGSHQTAAAFRDSMASNRSGIIWIDDLDDASSVYQDIRTATNEETRSKKAADNTATTSVRLVAPVLLTGEALPGISDQRALMDRLIQLDVPPAKGRQSLKGGHEQWLDIVQLKENHPELWRYSGWYVQHALLHAVDVMAQWGDLRPAGKGRHGDKVAAIKVGARLLAEMTEDDTHIERVDRWTTTMAYSTGDFLVHRILPEYLRTNMVPTTPVGWHGAFVDGDGIVWFHSGRLSDWWCSRPNLSARERTFGVVNTLDHHRQAMGIGAHERRKFRVNRHGDSYNQQNYYPCSAEVSQQILDLAGIDTTEAVLTESQ